ncbi:MAG: HAMP domain-containing protein [Acidobacteria bacterium]|nr:HAMP domain-containing protein [Acidobacteriota bacterium]
MIFSALLVFVPLLFSALIIGYIVKSSIDDQSAQSMEKDARVAEQLYKNRELLIVQIVQNSAQSISAQGLFDLTQAPTSTSTDPKSATGRVQEEGTKRLAGVLNAAQQAGNIDFIVLTDSKGNIIARQAQGSANGSVGDNPLIVSVQNAVTASRTYAQSSSVKESAEKINLLGGEELAKRAEIKAEGRSITDGLVIEAAAPITNNSGRLLGIVLAGLLVNNAPQDRAVIEDIKTKLYPSLPNAAGASVTLNDVIVSTNIPIPQNGALGKRTSVAASDAPKTSIENFSDEAYKSAYVPIKDSSNQVIGRVGVQVKQSWFNAVLNKVLLIIVLIVLVFILGAIGVAIFAAQKLTKPIIELTEASNNISLGKLDESIQIKSDDEIGQLAEALERMRISLKQALDRLRSRRAQQQN